MALRTLILVAVTASTAAAQTTTTGQDPVRFPGGDRDNGIHAATILQMGVTPRGVALGEALGAVGGDPSAIWYNTAGIARIRTNSFFVTGSQRFGGTQLAGAAVTFPTAIGTFGVAARGFNAGTIEVSENGNLFGRARAFQMVLEGGGAIELTDHWLWGGTLFYAQETLADDSRGSIGINSAMLFPDIFGRLTLGTGIRNWGTPVRFDQMAARPPMFVFGAASFDLLRHRNLIQTPLLFRGEPILIDAKAVGQLDVPYRNELIPRLGIEATVNGVAIGRLGYQWGDDNRAGLSAGAGVNVGQFRLEYGFRNRYNAGAPFFSEDPISDEHHVSATYFWGEQEANIPMVPVIVTQPMDTAAINAAIRQAVASELERLRPLLDSLRAQRVEIVQQEELLARYIVPVHFGFDSAVVRDEDMHLLEQVAEVIRRVYPRALVTIEGFTDPAGTAEYNQRLGMRRAEAVRDVMVTRFNLPRQQFRTVAYGQQVARQVVPGAERDDPGAMLNRRVTFVIDATQRF